MCEFGYQPIDELDLTDPPKGKPNHLRPHSDLYFLIKDISLLSQWIDEGGIGYEERHPEAWLWYRVTKCAEECGEVISALTGMLGWNRRKGCTHTIQDVRTELLDVAVAALGAYEHVSGNRGSVGPALVEHIQFLKHRAGLSE